MSMSSERTLERWALNGQPLFSLYIVNYDSLLVRDRLRRELVSRRAFGGKARMCTLLCIVTARLLVRVSGEG